MIWLLASGGQSIRASAISPSNKSSGLISFKIDWFDLLAVQGTLLQHYSSEASILWHSAFFMVQLSHPYMSTRKTIGLTRQTFIGKVMSLLFNTLSGFVIASLPRSKHLLISWLQSPSAVILEPQSKKSVTTSILSPFVSLEAGFFSRFIKNLLNVEQRSWVTDGSHSLGFDSKSFFFFFWTLFFGPVS